MKKLLSLFFLAFSVCFGQDGNLIFENISTFQGLSSTRAKCIFQDSKGYMWFGTQGGGINRFDGYNFTVYKQEPDVPGSIIHNNIYDIDEDLDGNIWIAATDGISIYLPSEDKFKNYFLADYIEEISNHSYSDVYSILVDSKDRIWIGHSHLGVISFDYPTEKFEINEIRQSRSSNSEVVVISDMEEDADSRIWVASSIGLLFYDEANRVFRHAKMNKASLALLNDQYIFRVYSDSQNKLWLMSSTGLFRYYPNSGEAEKLLDYDFANPINNGYEGELWEDEDENLWVAHINLPHLYVFQGLSNKYHEKKSERLYATDFYIDSFGTIWISDWFEGLYKYDPSRQPFYKLQSENFVQITGVNAISESATNPDEVIISDDGAGWGAYNIFTGSFKLYGKHSGINTILPNKDGSIWLGHWGDGVQKWDSRTGNYTRYFADSTKFSDLPDGRITYLYRDSAGTFWISAVNGLFRSNDTGSELEHIISGHAVIRFIFDGQIIWCTSYGEGLVKYDRRDGTTRYFKHDKKANSISHNVVWDIYKDEEGFLWLATNKGLNKFDPESEEFQVYLERDGLANEHIASILPDQNGEIWLATLGGISHLHYDSTKQVIFSNYNAQDGLANASFRNPISFKDNNNRLYFGGNGGMFWFSPVGRTSEPPVTHITDITVNGISILNSDLNFMGNESYSKNEIELDHNQSNLEFEYIGLHYAQPGKNRYAVKLDGHDEEWTGTNDRRVSYTNLEPGDYRFYVKAVNNEGVWSSESPSVSITISEPWWNTLPAYFAYLVIVLGLLLSVRQFELSRRKEVENKKILELENRRKTKELEEARELQLSMLPREIPVLPNLDIAVYMKTATEVGGDYYDFHVGMDGTLTVVIGDATGHGMKAGTMVTTTKSLFRVLAPNPDVTGTFNEMTKCIKEMDMPKLSMCMTLAKFTNGSMKISTAGMPPAYYYNKASGEVSELLTEGMPLGTFTDFPYEAQEVSLSSGDTILLLSDGMPELLSEEGEMFGYDRVNAKFKETADKKPEEIITELKDTASEWVNDKDPGDDVTFVVIKVK